MKEWWFYIFAGGVTMVILIIFSFFTGFMQWWLYPVFMVAQSLVLVLIDKLIDNMRL